MKRFPRPIAIGCAVLLAVAVARPPGQAAAASTTLQRKIDALLKHRLKPEPLPVNPPNPFQLIGGVKREGHSEETIARPAGAREDVVAAGLPTAENSAKELAASQQSEILITCATRLRLGGVVILKDQIQIVVNGVPRKEGDTIAADWNRTIIYLKIARLLPGQMVLRYGEAEATVKF